MSEINCRQNAEIAKLIYALSPADLSDSTLSYTETEAASSSNVTPGEFSGGCVPPVVSGSLNDDVYSIQNIRPPFE